MKILLDMNLSPQWVGFLWQEGFEVVHWSSVGDVKASDAVVMEWARQQGFVVFTHGSSGCRRQGCRARPSNAGD